ncbi:MAG: DUF3276 family protein [Chitinophagales bacterium]|nr:DUF3276 family protein [Bacteroidota bacterium]
MENEKNYDKNGVYSKRIRAGKRRTYFFDVRTTRANDYYLTITESKKRMDDDNYERHKIFIYKEDFVKFVNAMQETIDYVKTELLPDYDFEAHNYDNYDDYKSDSDSDNNKNEEVAEVKVDTVQSSTNSSVENVDEEAEKWD